MNILIPIGGIGQRFKDENYLYPKPLISVLGKPMIYKVIENLNTTEEDTIYIAYNNQLKEYNFEDLINFWFPNKNIKFVSLNKLTRGASETIFDCLNEIPNKELDKEFLILDCDTFYEEDIVSTYKKSPNKNLIFYFKDTTPNPIFSYIKLDGKTVTSIKEKQKISDNANTGAYGFSSGHLLKDYISQILSLDKELYVSYIYDKMLSDKKKITSHRVSNFHCVGTPLQLQIYCNNNKADSKPLRICFDFDNTLVSYPTIPGDYSSVKPITKNIKFLRLLKGLGHTIIIYTARRMRTHGGNVGKVVADISQVTLDTLNKFDIPYDEIYFGKPYANFYIDDLAVNPYISLNQSIGIYDTHTTPRSFNQIEYQGDKVIKTTSNTGEIFWYQNIPSNISEYFPKVFEAKNNTLVLENIEGVSFSYSYINKNLKLEDLDNLLSTLETIHTTSSTTPESGNIYANYLPKLIFRYEHNKEIYSKFSGSKLIYELLTSKLSSYKSGKVGIIHGDPVFTNVLKIKHGLKLIDMRGKLGNEHSIMGDIYYDYAKIYQSLIGYDFILNDLEIDNVYTNKFVSHFETKFTPNEILVIKLITASLLFTLIPLHDVSYETLKKYFKLIENLLV
jgi:capsule biosynthesis phosphatase